MKSHIYGKPNQIPGKAVTTAALDYGRVLGINGKPTGAVAAKISHRSGSSVLKHIHNNEFCIYQEDLLYISVNL